MFLPCLTLDLYLPQQAIYKKSDKKFGSTELSASSLSPNIYYSQKGFIFFLFLNFFEERSYLWEERGRNKKNGIKKEKPRIKEGGTFLLFLPSLSSLSSI